MYSSSDRKVGFTVGVTNQQGLHTPPWQVVLFVFVCLLFYYPFENFSLIASEGLQNEGL
jgi:hypothetical protein